MADEIQFRMSLQVKNGSQHYGPSQPSAQILDQDNPGGPTPGQLDVTVQGVAVNLSVLDVPGICWMQNLDTTYHVEYGIYDPETLAFFPLGELMPGEAWAIRLSRNLAEQYYGTSTSTTAGAQTNQLMLKAAGPTGTICKVVVHAFEK